MYLIISENKNKEEKYNSDDPGNAIQVNYEDQRAKHWTKSLNRKVSQLLGLKFYFLIKGNINSCVPETERSKTEFGGGGVGGWGGWTQSILIHVAI